MVFSCGPGWIRTNEGIKPADLQSAPFDRFGTDPVNLLLLYIFNYKSQTIKKISQYKKRDFYTFLSCSYTNY
jgi:hypothetical protein